MRLIAEHVNVDFPIYGAQRSFRKALFERATGGIISSDARNANRTVIRALTDVSFELHEGDRLGLVGHNGAGKSTLLRTLAGVYQPVSGRIMVDGVVTPLFEALPGLDSEDTGYENIRTSAMMFGLKPDQIEKLTTNVEEFSELGEFMGLPVRTYSTGMTTRLGFAFATSIEPGILLMDEGIGAGDARFADRAAERMAGFLARSRIVVIASHSDHLIRSMCNKAALMHTGRVVSLGDLDAVLDEYHAFVHGANLEWAQQK
ncbi:MAG: ABC transporter ATP-binding protein [Bradyrhizobium sp.]|nr:ABC transporter ATP-binding protein [Bradyrhizobium sp.]